MKRDPDTRRGIYTALKAVFDAALSEPVPESIDATLKRLGKK